MLEKIRERFENLMFVLESNNATLKIISDLVEKQRSREPFDPEFVEGAIHEIRSNVAAMIDNMVELGGESYAKLYDTLDEIMARVEVVLSDRMDIEKDDFIISFDDLSLDSINRAGGKNSRLGEIKTRAGMHVPAGFAISAWAYKRFVAENKLYEPISRLIEGVDINNYQQLEDISRRINDMIRRASVPEDVGNAIMKAFDKLTAEHPGSLVALRSSAIGEDMAFSFAGQYKTFLGVRRYEILERYRDVIASKYAPKAIFYYISNQLEERELAMSVSCMVMIDARSAGVVYTRDPVNPESHWMIVNSIYGLGKNLVSGEVTPDVFYISRHTPEIHKSIISDKTKMLRVDPYGDLYQDIVPYEDRRRPSISETHVRELALYARRMEEHFRLPLDIEWAIDRSGIIYILQARPLRILKNTEGYQSAHIDLSRHKVLTTGGTTICPGAASGRVHVIRNRDDLGQVEPGGVLAASTPFPSLITALEQAAALVTRTGSIASHLATIAREYGVPSIFGVADFDKFEEGMEVTVDANNCYVFEGIEEELERDLRHDKRPYRYEPRFGKLQKIIEYLSPLNLIQTTDENFTIRHCGTIHDITRFTHQKSLEELYNVYEKMLDEGRVGIRLEGKIPLKLDLIYIDIPPGELKEKKINDHNLISEPMQAFWNGVLTEGWPHPLPTGMKGITSAVAHRSARYMPEEALRRSFAVLHREFMLLSLKMGYHFSTIEAICTPDADKNYIKMQFKDGGASLGRRTRRIKLITSVLSHYGFENHSRGDFLDTTVSHESARQIKEKLSILGRLAMLTKQLDMALSNDQITEWYTRDILRKLESKSRR